MATLEDYFFVKNTKWFLWGALALIVAALIFHAGVVVGSHNIMEGREQEGGFVARIPFGGGAVDLPQGFMPGGHGALGTITSVSLPTLTLITRDGMLMHVEINGDTQIRSSASSTSASNLEVGDTVIVIGDPDMSSSTKGAVDARLIRIFPN